MKSIIITSHDNANFYCKKTITRRRHCDEWALIKLKLLVQEHIKMWFTSKIKLILLIQEGIELQFTNKIYNYKIKSEYNSIKWSLISLDNIIIQISSVRSIIRRRQKWYNLLTQSPLPREEILIQYSRDHNKSNSFNGRSRQSKRRDIYDAILLGWPKNLFSSDK